MAERLMKDSGINYIGVVPANWKITKFKRIKDENNPYPIGDGDHGAIKPEDYKDEGVPYIRVQNLDWGSELKTEDIVYISPDVSKKSAKSELKPGDILIAKTGATIGKTAIIPDNMPIANTTSSVGKVTVDKVSNDNKYIYYLIRSDVMFNQMWDSARQKSAQPGFNIDELTEYYICIPPKEEQIRIANFLDKKVSEIDNAIKKTKQSIEEYKKLKQAIIIEAVTKGLNPDVEMKDSGIEWVGNSPKHWKNYLLFQLFSQVKNKNTGMKESNLLSLSYGNIVRKNINTTNGLLPENFEGYNIVEKDDIVLRLTDLQNDHKSLRTGLVKEKGIITSAYLTLRNISANNPKYLRYYLHSFDISKGFYGMGDGVRQGLNWDELKTLKVCMPSVEEQDEIVNTIETKIDKYEKLIKQKNMFVDDLEQYKKSLIYEYVTGKKEVA